MSPRLLADLVVVVHFAFVLFVVLGGLLVLRWPGFRWIHLPAAVWGAIVEFSGSALRAQAGEAGYTRDFISRYVLPTLYPAGLTRSVQLILGAIVVGLNCAVYAWVWRRRKMPLAESSHQ
jgi:hypothetical protein